MTATNAIAFGERIEFDGIDEGLVWPKLAKAFEHAGGGASAAGAVVIQLERDVPIQTLLRAVFTMQARNLRVQSRDESGALHVVELNAKPAVAPAGRPCHLAVFLKPDGSIRVAAPGGSRDITAPKAADQLAQALQAEMPTCGIKYVAFGAESNDVPFGPVFDVMIAVDRVKAAGDARYVLGEAIHGAPPR